MTDAVLFPERRGRHWLADALLGGGIALGLITFAHAALPKVDASGLTPKRIAAAVQASREAPAVAAVASLIAFSEPLPGYDIGSPFGLRQLPWEEGGRLHAGVDIAAPSGEPIRVAADGVIVRMGQDGGYGRFVEVRHAEGLTTLYGHMGGFAAGLQSGVAVKAGQPLGQIGSTGTSTGSHLHFEVHDAKDRPLNPELFLGRSFARAEDLPLRQALRVPRRVRVAYVSMIPKAKKQLMEAKADAELQAQLAALDASQAAAAASADEVASDATDAPPTTSPPAATSPAAKPHRRVHGRYRM